MQGSRDHRDQHASRQPGRHFLQIPGPTNVPERVLGAIALPTIDHRGPAFAALASEVLRQIRTIFKTEQPVIIYPSSGTGAWEAALVNTLSPGDPVLMAETGHFASLWREMAERLGVQPEFLPGDWRHGADPAAIEARLASDRGHAHQGGLRRPQRDLHRRREPDRGDPPGDRSGEPPCPLHGRHHLLARLDRLPPRRVGRRRHRRRLAEGPDAAAGPRLQCGEPQGAEGERERWPAALVLGLAGDARGQCQGLLPLHAGEQPDLRPARGDRDAARGRPRQRVRAPCAPRRGDPPGGQRLGPRDPVRGSARVFRLAHRRGHARGPQRRRPARTHPQALQPVARQRPVQAERPGVSHRPSRRLQRRDAGRHAVRRRDGAARARRRRWRAAASPPPSIT